jgi:Tol biopolymer transport system component
MMEERMNRYLTIFCVFLVVFSPPTFIHARRPMMPEDLYRIKRVSDPQISPDGKMIAFTISVPNLEDNNFNSDIWIMPISGGKPVQLTRSPEADHSPRWSPEGKRIAFISTRDGVANLYLIRVEGGEAVRVTSSETNLYSPIWTRDGEDIICGSRVMPEEKKIKENWSKSALPRCEARTINQLLFRQWDRWLGDERNHVFLVDPEDGSMKDLTPGDFDTPPVSLTSGHDFDISPDGSQICFVKNVDPMLAVSTNHDLFIADTETLQEKRLTHNPALDSQPHYSPDGRYIGYTVMEKAGYESDRKRLALYDRKEKKHVRLTEALDLSVVQILWSPHSRTIFFTTREQGRSSIYGVDLRGEIKKNKRRWLQC